MNKFLKLLILFAAFALFVFVFILDSSRDLEPGRAPWDTHRFRNYISPSVESSLPIASNRALADDLFVFSVAERVGRHRGSPVGAIASGRLPPQLNEQDIQIKNRFIDVFISGWEKDTLSQVMPFNSLYLRAYIGANINLHYTILFL